MLSFTWKNVLKCFLHRRSFRTVKCIFSVYKRTNCLRTFYWNNWMSATMVSEHSSMRFSFSTSVLIKWQWIFVIASRVTQCIYILLICGTCSNNFEFEIGFNLQFALSNNGDDAPPISVYTAWTAIGNRHRSRNDKHRKILLLLSTWFSTQHTRPQIKRHDEADKAFFNQRAYNFQVSADLT